MASAFVSNSCQLLMYCINPFMYIFSFNPRNLGDGGYCLHFAGEETESEWCSNLPTDRVCKWQGQRFEHRSVGSDSAFCTTSHGSWGPREWKPSLAGNGEHSCSSWACSEGSGDLPLGGGQLWMLEMWVPHPQGLLCETGVVF